MWILDWDELYPVYSIEERDKLLPYTLEVELDQEFIERYHRVSQEWGDIQEILDKIRREKNGT